MVLSPISSLAASERKMHRSICGESVGPKEGLGRDIGIVEGWGDDEDEDVNIDSDEKDSRSEGLLAAAENLQLESVPTGGSSLQLLSCSGERAESSTSGARYEDPASRNERSATLNKVASPNVAVKGNGSGVLTGKHQVGSFQGEPVKNGKNATCPQNTLVSSSCGDSGGGSKRLDARRFRRDFNVKVGSIPAKNKVSAPDGGKKLLKEIDMAAGKGRDKTPTKSHIPTTDKKGTSNFGGDYYGKSKRFSREEISKPADSGPQVNRTDRMALGGERCNPDSNKKRRFNDQDYAQAFERKSSLRVRRDSSKHSEGRMSRETRGYADAGSLAKSKRARNDDIVSEVGALVSEKQRGPEKVGKSSPSISTKGERQNSAVDNRNQRPLPVRANSRRHSGKEENSLLSLSGDGLKTSDSDVAKEVLEVGSLERVFERRPTKRNDTVKGTGENPESKRLSGQSVTTRQLSGSIVGVVRTFDQKTQEKGSGKPADKRHEGSVDKAEGAEKTQQSGGGSDESQNCTSKQRQERERGGLNLRRRPTRSSEKVTEGTDKVNLSTERQFKGQLPLRTKGISCKGPISVSEDADKDLKNFGAEMHISSSELSGSALKTSGAGEIALGEGEKLHGKRRQSRVTDMENNGRSQSRGNNQEEDSEVKKGEEGEIAGVGQQTKAKKQRLIDEKCSAMTVSTADVVSPVVEALANQSSPQIHEGNDKSLEEGEIPSSDSAGIEVSEFTEPVLRREDQGETRLGENDTTHGDRKSGTVTGVHLNDLGLSRIQLRPCEIQVAVENVENKERTPLLEGARDGNERAIGTLDLGGHVGPSASTLASDDKLEPVADSGEDKPQNVTACSESTKRENDCTDRQSVQEENQIDELCVQEHFPTSSHESRGTDEGGETKSHSARKLERIQTSEFQTLSDLIGEDRSESDDGRTSDHHNSYCECCRQGGQLLCCDGSGCKITYHLECTDPKLVEVPSGNWYCPMCAHKRLSYGVHAVSKSVESIWDVRNRAQSSGHPSSLPKDVAAIDLYGVTDKDPGTTGISLEDTKGRHVKNRDKVEDECIAAVSVVVDDEEGVLGTTAAAGRQQTSQETGVDCDAQGQTERRHCDGNGKTPEKSRLIEAKIISGSSSSAMRVPKLMDGTADKEYFVKWRGISHAHNTWVAESELAKLSPKVLAKFKKKIAEGQVVQWNPDWAQPQRLVDKRVSIPPRRPGGGRGRGFLGMDTQQEWFVKWKGLGYEHCTWEPAHSGILSDEKFKQLETVFDRWTEAARQRNDPQRVVEVDKLREGSYEPLQSQPEWIRFGKLLPYQMDRLNQLRQRWHHHQNTIIVDQDDQETSSTTVAFLLSLIEEYGVYRLILIVVPAYEIQCWEAEITENAPQVDTVVYMGSKEARGVIQRFELNRRTAPLKVQVVLTTCDIAFSDFDYLRKHKWEVVAVDESLQSKTAKSHRAFLQFDTTFWLRFASELSKYNVEELQQMLFLFQPHSSSPTSNARRQLTGSDESGHLQYLKDQLSEHILRDNRREDASGLKLVECWVGTNMTSLQIQLYCNTLIKHYSLLQSGRLRIDPDSPSLHDFLVQLRLCCQHPYLVDPTLQGCGKGDFPSSQALIDAGVEASEKWQLIHAMLSVLHLQHRRVVILSQSLMQLYFLDDYLRQKYGADSYELVDSRHSSHRKNAAVQRFNAKDSARSFILLRTSASGFSLKLKDKDVVIIHDSDLNPANDLEYLRKVLHRVDGELKVFRLYQRLTVEEGSMIYDHQKKLGADSKPLSVKILQQLLRWKVQQILQLDSSSSSSTNMPKGKQKLDLDERETRDLKRVSNFLQGNLGMEAAIETPGDEVWNDEDGDSVKEFWCSLLKDRYGELQDREEQSNPGKGLRQRKRVQYSEEALASYSAPEAEELRRKRRRPQQVESTSILVNQDKETHFPPLIQSLSKQADSCHDEESPSDKNLSSRSVPEVRTAVTSEFAAGLNVPVTDHNAGKQGLEPVGIDGIGEHHNQEAEQKASIEAISTPVPKRLKREQPTGCATTEAVRVNKSPKPTTAGNVSSTSSQIDSYKRVRMEQKQQVLKLEPELSRICDILQVEERIAGYSKQLLAHVMTYFRMPKEPRELVVMIEISLCLIACADFQVVDHLTAVSRVGERMNLALRREEFASVYSRVNTMCKSYTTPPLVQQGIGNEEKSLDEAAHRNTAQPIATGIELPVQIPPTSQVSASSPLTKDNLRPSSVQQSSIDQNNSSEICVAPVSKAKVAHVEQNDPLGTGFEQSEQQAQGEDCQESNVIIEDPTLRGHTRQEASTNNLEVNVDLGHNRSQPVAVSPEKTQLLRAQTGEATRARLKSDRDKLLHTWLARQKLEVQEFNANCARERDACQKSFEKQKAEILTTVNMDQRDEMLRQLGEVSASTVKLFEREGEDRRQEMNRKQRDLRDRINALYINTLQQINTGVLTDLVSEARSVGLSFATQSRSPKLLENGPTRSKQSLFGGASRAAQQSAAPRSLPDQNKDLGSFPSTLGVEVQPHPQHQPQPQSLEGTPSPPADSQPPLPQSHLPYQARARLQSHQVATFFQPLSQAVSSNLDQGASTFEELGAALPKHSHPPAQRPQIDSLQQNAQTTERPQISLSPVNIVEASPGGVGSEPTAALSSDEPQRTRDVVEQGAVPSRVSEMPPTSTVQQSMVSLGSQTATNLQPRGSQILQVPVNLQPRVTQNLHMPTSLQARISRSIQASPSLQPRVSQTVVTPSSQVPENVDSLPSLQPRVAQNRRPVSSQQAARHPSSLHHTAVPQVRAQTQVQQSGGQGSSIPSAIWSVNGSLLANQARSNVHAQNAPLGVHSSQSPFGPDPLAHEENRLKREQEFVKLQYNEETTQIRAQFEREAAELWKKYEGLLDERARTLEQRTVSLKNNLDKVDRNRQLTEALKMRSMLDQPKARQTPGHSSEVMSGSGSAGRLSGHTNHISGRNQLHLSNQSNSGRHSSRATGRVFASAVVSVGSGPGSGTDVGTPNSTAQLINGGSQVPSWQSSRPSSIRSVQSPGLALLGPGLSALPNGVPRPQEIFSSTGFVSIPEAFPHTNTSLSSCSSPFAVISERVLFQPLSAIQQGRTWVSHQEGIENVMAPSSSVRVENLSSHNSSSEFIPVLSSSTGPGTSITTAVSSPTVTEAVLVSVSPVLSPVGDKLTNIEFAGNMFVQGGQNNFGGGPISANEVIDLLMPLPSENQVSSAMDTRVRSEGGAASQEVRAPTQGHQGFGPSQPSTAGSGHNPRNAQDNVICLSDDED